MIISERIRLQATVICFQCWNRILTAPDLKAIAEWKQLWHDDW